MRTEVFALQATKTYRGCIGITSFIRNHGTLGSGQIHVATAFPPPKKFKGTGKEATQINNFETEQ